MPKHLFASNNISHFPGSTPGSVANTFDATRVPYAIALSNYQLISSPDFLPSSGTVTWFHFRSFADGNVSSIPNGASGTLFQCFDSLNRLLCKVAKRTSITTQDLTLTLYNGTTSIAINGTFPMTQSKMNDIDIALTITSVSLRVDLYINRSLAAFTTFGSNPNVLTNPIRFSLGCSHTEDLSMIQSFSEVLVSEGDTRNARMNFLRPASTGANSDWDGLLTALADDDPTTGMYTKLPNERQSMGLSSYVGAQNISNVITISQTTRGLNSPTKLKHTVRMSGVNYDSSDIAVASGLQYNIVDFQLNPATSLPWTSGDISALEVGFMSVA